MHMWRGGPNHGSFVKMPATDRRTGPFSSERPRNGLRTMLAADSLMFDDRLDKRRRPASVTRDQRFTAFADK